MHGEGTVDLAWFDPDGNEMSDEQWNEGDLQTVMIFLGGDSIERTARGEDVHDTDFLWLVNAGFDPVDFAIPDAKWGEQWRVADRHHHRRGRSRRRPTLIEASSTVSLPGHTLMLLEHVDGERRPRAERMKWPVEPMKASSGRLPRGADWTYEPKWDGHRALVRVRGETIDAVSSSGLPRMQRWPFLAAVPGVVDDDNVILDGEVVAMDDNGRHSFQLVGRPGSAACVRGVRRADARRP